jgi:hypothetical protein
MKGAEIEFGVNGVRYRGTVNGDSMSGTYDDASGKPQPWKAERVK